EEKSSLQDLLIRDISDTTQVWTNFTLQSPSVPTVADYVALQKCILDGNCDFRDNRLDLVQDPDDPNNQVLRCTAVAVDEEIVTSKASLSSSVLFFGKGDEMWFAARYRIVEGEPFTMVDFENGHFAQHPGPRIVIRQDQIAMENKFGAKINHNNQSSLLVPRDQWFTLKIHLLYSNEADGMIEIWQDEEPILSLSGINLPTSNSIQNIVEIGASASQSGCVLLVDDVRISDEAF
ncbi:MAG: heparin lyase I family protein, partial [Bacteroidota bacterium]